MTRLGAAAWIASVEVHPPDPGSPNIDFKLKGLAMQLEIFEAFKAAGVSDQKAAAAAASIDRAIARRFGIEVDAPATTGAGSSPNAELLADIGSTVNAATFLIICTNLTVLGAFAALFWPH